VSSIHPEIFLRTLLSGHCVNFTASAGRCDNIRHGATDLRFSFEKRRKFKRRTHRGDAESTEKPEREIQCEMQSAK
jgi:hypothetical protein